MGTLKNDIKSQAEWIVKAFASDKLTLDYSIDSFIEIDIFYNQNLKNGKPKKGGRFENGWGSILFSIGSYIGEAIIKNVPGAEWMTDDNHPEGEINISIKLPDGSIIWPVQRAIKRFKNGFEDSIYPYAHTLTESYTKLPFNESFWTLAADREEIKKQWWKFW